MTTLKKVNKQKKCTENSTMDSIRRQQKAENIMVKFLPGNAEITPQQAPKECFTKTMEKN